MKKTQNRKVKAILADYKTLSETLSKKSEIIETLSEKYNISTKTISRMLKTDNVSLKTDNVIPSYEEDYDPDYDYDDDANDLLDEYFKTHDRNDENGITLADDMGLLYIAADTSHPGEYKIGKTNCNDPFRRELHTTSPRYKMLYMSVSRSVAEDEKKVHKWCKDILKAHIKFDHAKEWFRLDDDYLQFIIDKFDFVKAERPKEYIKWGGEMD